MLNNRISQINKLFFPILMVICLLISFVVPIYAYNPEPELRPSDVGEEILNYNYLPNGFYYVKVTYNTIVNNDEMFRFDVSYGDNVSRYMVATTHSSWKNTLDISYANDFTNFVLARPIYFSQSQTGSSTDLSSWQNTYYFSFAVGSRSVYNYFINFVPVSSNATITLYYMGNTGIDYDYAFLQGYLNGFDVGILEGAQIKEELNLVQYVNSLMANFVGAENARFITPLAIALVILFAYFAFIRILLSFIKSKNVLKVTDIVVCVACVAVLLVMYIPMIPFNITQNQIITHVYEIASDVVVGG